MSKASIGRKAATAVDIYVGQKMRARRFFLLMSQAELSEALGITFQQVQKYERGALRVGAQRLQKISDALGVSPFYFFDGAPTVEKKTPAPKKVFVSKAPVGRRAASAADIRIGRKIRARRLFLGITQTDLSETLGIRFTQIQKYETGAQRPAPARLQKISDALDVSPSYFLEGAPTAGKKTPVPKKEFVSEASIEPKASRVIDALRDAYIGKRIRMRRMMVSMPRWRLGDALGITEEQVQEYENGTEHIEVSILQKICNALYTSPSFFLEGAPTVRKTTPAPETESISTEPVDRKAGNAVDAHVGRKIRARRMVMGMSQTELGDALGITLQQVRKYEKGRERVGASRLQKISVALDVAASYFFEGSPAAGK
jgi:transcriptional regulator with XRE-family HTH domain